MNDIRLTELIDLASEDIDGAEDKIQKTFDWYYDRTIMTIKGTIGGAASLLIAILISFFKQEFKIGNIELWSAISFCVLTASYGFYKMFQLNQISRQYIASIKLLSELKKIRPFLSLYRSILNRDNLNGF